jgi:hypothetical protein
MRKSPFLPGLLVAVLATTLHASPLRLSWANNILTIHDARIAGGELKVWYLEDYCRPGAHTAEWHDTTIGHSTTLLSISDDAQRLELRCELRDGVIVHHTITAGTDAVDFRLTVHNPTDAISQAHWAQPCIRVGTFTGMGPEHSDDKYAYIRKSFIFLDDTFTQLPCKDWATEAKYVPGQVWAGPGVPDADVNPRPLNPNRPSNGLIGCFSADGKMIMATAWDPWHELFQGIIRCLHSDFRIGGLAPGERKKIHGKIYLLPADIPALRARYKQDFSPAED